MYEFSDQLMSDIRNRFEHVDVCPHQGARVFFENAGGALTLKSVVEVSHEFAAVPDNQGRENRASRALVDTINLAKDDVRCFFARPGWRGFHWRKWNRTVVSHHQCRRSWRRFGRFALKVEVPQRSFSPGT